MRVLQSEYEHGELLRKLKSDLERQQAQVQEETAQRATRPTPLNVGVSIPHRRHSLDIHPRVGEAVNLYETYARVSPKGELT